MFFLRVFMGKERFTHVEEKTVLPPHLVTKDRWSLQDLTPKVRRDGTC